MFTVLVVLLILASLLLILITFVQNSRKEGSTSDILNSMHTAKLVGVKRSIDILEKMTLYIFAFIIFICLLSHKVLKKDKIRSPNLEKIKNDYAHTSKDDNHDNGNTVNNNEANNGVNENNNGVRTDSARRNDGTNNPQTDEPRK